MSLQHHIQYQVIAEPVTVTAGETISEDKWHQPWSLPRWSKPPLPIGAYPFLAYSESAQFPETVTEGRWHQPWSEPSVKAKIGLLAASQQFIAYHPSPSPFVATGWYDWLSEPVRIKPGLPTREQQILAFHPAPSPFVATGWFDWLSEPVRLKPGLRPSLQQFFTIDTAVIPLQELIEWFAPFSEPVRVKPGLSARLQQFLAYHPRILPTPNVTGILAAQEQLDSLVFDLLVYNAVLSAETSIKEFGRQLSPVSIFESTGKSANVGVQASLPVTASGAAVTPTVTANVSIREV